MKYIFSLFLVFSFIFSFGQINPSEMFKIYEMNFDQFETYALNKGYEIDEPVNQDGLHGVRYVKGLGYNRSYISLYDVFVFNRKTVDYQLKNSNQFLNFKTQLKNMGFRLYSSENYTGKDGDKSLHNIYRNKIWEFSINSIQGGYYEINLRKIL